MRARRERLADASAGFDRAQRCAGAILVWRLGFELKYRAIDAAEVARGLGDGRPRNKFTDVADMLAAAAAARQAPPLRQRLTDRLRELA